MFEFIKNMWILGRIDQNKISLYVTKGYITQQQANEIISLQQLNSQ